MPSVNNGNSALPPVRDVAVTFAESEFTNRGAGTIIQNLKCRSRWVGRTHSGSCEGSIDLRYDRAHAAGKIDAEDGIIGCCGRRIGKRQGGRIVDPHQRDRMRRIRRGIGIIDGNRITRRQAADIDIEAVLRWRRYRTTGNRLVRQRGRYSSRESIELILRLDKILIAHLQIRRDRSRTNRAILDQINRSTRWRNKRNCAHAAQGRI